MAKRTLALTVLMMPVSTKTLEDFLIDTGWLDVVACPRTGVREWLP